MFYVKVWRLGSLSCGIAVLAWDVVLWKKLQQDRSSSICRSSCAAHLTWRWDSMLLRNVRNYLQSARSYIPQDESAKLWKQTGITQTFRRAIAATSPTLLLCGLSNCQVVRSMECWITASAYKRVCGRVRQKSYPAYFMATRRVLGGVIKRQKKWWQ